MKAIDLFSGPGGLSLGMKKAGIKPELCVEFDKNAVDTYDNHTSDCVHMNCDIREVSFTKYRNKIDVVFGGPPCQPFSIGGKREGQDDKRDMIPEFIRCIAEVNPAVFVMENVPGLAMSKSKPYFDHVLRQLESLGYTLNWKVMYAADYGVSQKRKRLIILGSKEQQLAFPEPTHGKETGSEYVRAGDVLTLDGYGEPPKSPVTYAKKPDLRKNPYAGLVYNGGGRPIDLNGLCHTILASSGGSKTHWVDTQGVVEDYHQHLLNGGLPRVGAVPGARRLSVEECALIQTFPKDLEFSGSKSSQYTQIGNAVPPRMAEAIGRTIWDQLHRKKHKTEVKTVNSNYIPMQGELFI